MYYTWDDEIYHSIVFYHHKLVKWQLDLKIGQTSNIEDDKGWYIFLEIHKIGFKMS